MPISDLTYKVLAYQEVPNYNTDECVDWATEMIASGYDTESLLILAGLPKPTNFFETINYLEAAIDELGLKFRNGDDGILSYSAYYIQHISRSIEIKENLSKIYLYCNAKNYDKLIFDLNLLYWAWGDIDWGYQYTEYWPDANKNNIEQVVVNMAKEWLVKNEAAIKISLP